MSDLILMRAPTVAGPPGARHEARYLLDELAWRQRQRTMEKQLRVIKADGTTEAYLHTKVVGAMNNALSAAGRPDIALAERLAEIVTYYLYHKSAHRTVSSNEIFGIIKAVLVATGNENAAVVLSDHAIERRLKRARTEVLAIDMRGFADVERLRRTEHLPDRIPWDKTRIVQNLTAQAGLPHHTARAVAAMVEERVLSMGMTAIPLSLVKQLVLGETAVALRAQRELQTAWPEQVCRNSKHETRNPKQIPVTQIQMSQAGISSGPLGI